MEMMMEKGEMDMGEDEMDMYNHAVLMYGSGTTGGSTYCTGDYFFTTSYQYVVPWAASDSTSDLSVTYWEGSGNDCTFDTSGSGSSLSELEVLQSSNNGGSACGFRVAYEWGGADGVFVQINSNNAIARALSALSFLALLSLSA